MRQLPGQGALPALKDVSDFLARSGSISSLERFVRRAMQEPTGIYPRFSLSHGSLGRRVLADLQAACSDEILADNHSQDGKAYHVGRMFRHPRLQLACQYDGPWRL